MAMLSHESYHMWKTTHRFYENVRFFSKTILHESIKKYLATYIEVGRWKFKFYPESYIFRRTKKVTLKHIKRIPQ